MSWSKPIFASVEVTDGAYGFYCLVFDKVVSVSSFISLYHYNAFIVILLRITSL